MALVAKKVEPYSFDQRFERAVVLLACSRPRFYGRVARELDPDAMPSPAAADAIRAAHEIARDLGHGPESALMVVQRLRRWVHDGKFTHEQLAAVGDLLDTAEDDPQPEEGVQGELVPLLQQRLKRQAAQVATGEFHKPGLLDQTEQLIIKAKRLGIADMSLGTRVGESSFEVIEAVKHMDHLPTGIDPLDFVLNNGPPRANLAMFVGSGGAGKSMCLNHVTAHAARKGMFAAYATLEISEAEALARFTANVTGITIDEIKRGSGEAKQKMLDAEIGPSFFRYFTPGATTVQDLRDWVNALEQVEGRALDLLTVDYADKMQAPIKDKSSYAQQGTIYEELRNLLVEKNCWGWTASQSRGRDEAKAKRLDLEHLADSIAKGRVADLVVTFMVNDEMDMTMFVAKNRVGAGRKSVGPMRTDFEHGAVIHPNDPSKQTQDLFEPGSRG